MPNRRGGKKGTTSSPTKGTVPKKPKAKQLARANAAGSKRASGVAPTQSTSSAAAGPPVTNWDELPVLLRPWPDIARLLRISRTRVYTLLPTMPGVVRLSQRQYRVNRDALRSYLESRAQVPVQAGSTTMSSSSQPQET